MSDLAETSPHLGMANNSLAGHRERWPDELTWQFGFVGPVRTPKVNGSRSTSNLICSPMLLGPQAKGHTKAPQTKTSRERWTSHFDFMLSRNSGKCLWVSPVGFGKLRYPSATLAGIVEGCERIENRNSETSC